MLHWLLRAAPVVLGLTFALPARAQTPASSAPSDPPLVALDTVRARPNADGMYISGACPNRTRCIVLTFDDGPDAPLTNQLLEILDQRHLHATFFVEGQHLDATDPANVANRATLREAHRRGHLIGNHTYHHRVMNRLNDAELAFEIDRTSDLIAGTIGERPGFFRAPYGMLGTARAIRAVAGRHYTLTRWVLDPRDWAEHTPEAVLRNFRYQLHRHPNGGVLLMHDVHPSTIAAVPLVLDEIERQNAQLRAHGEAAFEIITLDTLYRAAHRRR